MKELFGGDIMEAISIGTEFEKPGKQRIKCRVTDIYTTFNHVGDVVKIAYVSEHEFCGQTITDYDVPASTIIRYRIAR